MDKGPQFSEFDGVPMDSFGRPTTDRMDIRSNVLHGLVSGSLKVYTPDYDDGDGWGEQCSTSGCSRYGTLLVGDDPSHHLVGTPMCEKHYRAMHGHRTPDYVVHPDDYEDRPKRRVSPHFDNGGGSAKAILDGVTSAHHPAIAYQDDLAAETPTEVMHGSTQPLRVGDKIEPGVSNTGFSEVSGGKPVAYSTLNPVVAMTYALGLAGNTRGIGNRSTVVLAEPLLPEKVNDRRDAHSSEGLTHTRGLRVTKVLASTSLGNVDELQRQLGSAIGERKGV